MESDSESSSSSASSLGLVDDIDLDNFDADKKPSIHAHNLQDKKPRSQDILDLDSEYDGTTHDFSGLQISPRILEGLSNCGFIKPSPIQLKGIPIGRLGCDMIIQAKSGTGKTAVFSILALEKIDVRDPRIQVLIVAPTREIAYQSKLVVDGIGAKIEGLNTKVFIGGVPVEPDVERLKNCHIVVGTPGRLVHLIKDYSMDLSALKLFVQDEVDKLYEKAFFDDLHFLYEQLPKEGCQVIVASATYSQGIDDLIARSMKDPVRIQLDREAPVLEAVEQYAIDVQKLYAFKPKEGQAVKHEEIYGLKYRAIMGLINLPHFNQVIIFVNNHLRAERIYEDLIEEKIDVIHLSSAMGQKDRLKAFSAFQLGEARIMVATDLVSRGLDFENVDLVINYENPPNLETYLHRMGRTGRFGTFGTNVILVGFEYERRELETYHGQIPTLKIFNIDDDITFKKIGIVDLDLGQDDKKTLKLLALEKDMARQKVDDEKWKEAEKSVPSLGDIWNTIGGEDFYPHQFDVMCHCYVDPQFVPQTVEQIKNEVNNFWAAESEQSKSKHGKSRSLKQNECKGDETAGKFRFIRGKDWEKWKLDHPEL